MGSYALLTKQMIDFSRLLDHPVSMDYDTLRRKYGGLVPLLGTAALLFLAACSEPPVDDDPGSRFGSEVLVEGDGGLLRSDGAGSTVFLGEEPVCSRCDLEIHPLGSFGSMEDSILLRGLPIVERDGLGRFVATVPFPTRQEVILYDLDGTIVRRIGRTGRGPGEFMEVSDLRMASGDTLLIAHDFRVSVFDSAGRPVRTWLLQPPPSPPVPRRIAARGEGGLLMVEIRREDTLFHPLHRYDETGQYLGPAGAPHFLAEAYREAGRGGFGDRLRPAAFDPDGQLWVLGPGYRLERTDMSGRRTRVIGVAGPPSWGLTLRMTPEEHSAHWARIDAAGRAEPPAETRGDPPDEEILLTPTRPPWSQVLHFAVFDRDFLVVAVHVPAEDWREARSLYALHELYDTVLDLVDVETGVVLARTRIPAWARFTSDGTLYTVRESPVGLISFDAWEVSIEVDEEELDRIRSDFRSNGSDQGASS